MEIGAYYVPWLDNALDAIASPLSVVAGAILFAASVTGFDPFWQWSLAIIAGGGAAAMVQGGTVAARLASTATTGGLANFVVNTVETIFGAVFSVLAIVVPVVALVLLWWWSRGCITWGGGWWGRCGGVMAGQRMVAATAVD